MAISLDKSNLKLSLDFRGSKYSAKLISSNIMPLIGKFSISSLVLFALAPEMGIRKVLLWSVFSAGIWNNLAPNTPNKFEPARTLHSAIFHTVFTVAIGLPGKLGGLLSRMLKKANDPSIMHFFEVACRAGIFMKFVLPRIGAATFPAYLRLPIIALAGYAFFEAEQRICAYFLNEKIVPGARFEVKSAKLIEKLAKPYTNGCAQVNDAAIKFKGSELSWLERTFNPLASLVETKKDNLHTGIVNQANSLINHMIGR